MNTWRERLYGRDDVRVYVGASLLVALLPDGREYRAWRVLAELAAMP